MEILQMLGIIMNILLVLKVTSSAVMCVCSYKWRKGLIAITSTYFGFALGILITMGLTEMNVDFEIALIGFVVCVVSFPLLAYKWIWLNHFLTGFLVTEKVLFMIIYRLMSNNIIDNDIEMLLAIPIICGTVAGVAISGYAENRTVLICMVYIGSVDFVMSFSDMINKGLFVSTFKIKYLVDPESMILKFFGVQVPSEIEIILIVLVGIFSFIYQARKMDSMGINLSDRLIDDRKKDLL